VDGQDNIDPFQARNRQTPAAACRSPKSKSRPCLAAVEGDAASSSGLSNHRSISCVATGAPFQKGRSHAHDDESDAPALQGLPGALVQRRVKRRSRPQGQTLNAVVCAGCRVSRQRRAWYKRHSASVPRWDRAILVAAAPTAPRSAEPKPLFIVQYPAKGSRGTELSELSPLTRLYHRPIRPAAGAHPRPCHTLAEA